MTRLLKAFWEPKGALYHGGAVVYAVAGYGTGLYGLFLDNWALNLLAMLLLAHAMTIAAYMIHECGHNTVFRSNRANARLGSAARPMAPTRTSVTSIFVITWITTM
jgi:fatty acid desaturase